MRIALVHPTGANWVAGGRDVSATANRMAPLGLLSIAAWLERAGHEVFVHDCLGPIKIAGNAAHAEAILALRPDLVGFSATTSAFLDGYDLAERIKRQRPEVITAFGGVHVSALGGPLLTDFPAIDYLCVGEGEETLRQLADGTPAPQIPGLVYRTGDGFAENPPRQHLPDLDALPFPAYEKLAGFPKGYHLPLFSYTLWPGATMITSRGCPYQCSYCDRSVFKRGYRYNSAAYVYEHMRYLRDRFGVRHINIYDDLFTTHQGRITQLCERLIEEPLGMRFNCAVRVGHADPELLALLKAAGFLQLSLGIETGDPDLMDAHKPGVKLAEIHRTVSRIRAAGMRVKGLFMMGLPGETERSIQRTSDLIMSLDLDDMNLSKFTPFPGAPVWKEIRKAGTLEEDWRKMNCLNFVFVPSAIASRERLDLLYNLHVKRFYSDPKWRRRFRGRLWEHRRSLWHLIRHLPAFLSAMKTFEPERDAE